MYSMMGGGFGRGREIASATRREFTKFGGGRVRFLEFVIVKELFLRVVDVLGDFNRYGRLMLPVSRGRRFHIRHVARRVIVVSFGE